MIEFVKRHSKPVYLALYLGSSGLGLYAPMLFGMNIQNFRFGTFFLLFLLNLLPGFVLFLYSGKIRKSIKPDLQFSWVNWFFALFIGGILISLSLLPLALVFFPLMFGLSRLMSGDVAATNFYGNLIFYPVFYPVMFYMLGAYSRIMAHSTPTYSLREAFRMFRVPYARVIVQWSLPFYVLPAVVRTASFKIANVPIWVQSAYAIYNFVVALAGMYLVLFLVELWERENGGLADQTTASN